jgi:hypothetical protein
LYDSLWISIRLGIGTAVLIFEKSRRSGARLVLRPNPVFVVSSKFADMKFPLLSYAEVNALATDTSAVRAQQALTALVKAMLRFEIFRE